jgi:hypothetical protein
MASGYLVFIAKIRIFLFIRPLMHASYTVQPKINQSMPVSVILAPRLHIQLD